MLVSHLLNRSIQFVNVPFFFITDVDDCMSNPCVNGSCMDTLGGYKCTCHGGFTGLNCNVNIDDCIASACQNNAICVDGISAYSCLCNYGYKGELCEIAIGWFNSLHTLYFEIYLGEHWTKRYYESLLPHLYLKLDI